MNFSQMAFWQLVSLDCAIQWEILKRIFPILIGLFILAILAILLYKKD